MDEMVMSPASPACEDSRITSMFSPGSCTLEQGSSCSEADYQADYPLFPRTVRRRSCLSNNSDQPLSESPSSKVRGGSGCMDKRVRGGQQPALGGQGVTLQSSHSQGSLRISFPGTTTAGSAGSGSLQDLNAMVTMTSMDSSTHTSMLSTSSPRTSAHSAIGVGSIPESSPFVFSGRIGRTSISDSLPPVRRTSHATLGSPDALLQMINSLTCSHSSMARSATQGPGETLQDSDAAAAPRNCRSSLGSAADLSNPTTPKRGYSFGRAASLPFRVSQLSLLAYAEEAVLLQQVCGSTLAGHSSLAGHSTSNIQ